MTTEKLTRICPVCSVDRKVVHESLLKGPGSDNYDLAVAVCENCSDCKAAIMEAESIRKEKYD